MANEDLPEDLLAGEKKSRCGCHLAGCSNGYCVCIREGNKCDSNCSCVDCQNYEEQKSPSKESISDFL